MITDKQMEIILSIIDETTLMELIDKYPPIKINTRCKDLTGQHQDESKGGQWTALYRIEKEPGNKYEHARWICIHDDGVTFKPIYIDHFGSCHSRGVVKTLSTSPTLNKTRVDKRRDLVGKTFGHLEILEEVGNINAANNRINYKVLCHACGNICIMHSHEFSGDNPKTHCGCLNPLSRDMVLIDKFFTDNNIRHKLEHKFDDCRDIKPLPFDTAVEGKPNYLLEYDGEQHFKEVPGKFDLEEDSFEIRHKHDLIKNKYCFDHKIPLIRIPFDAKWTEDDLKLETTRFLLTPENESKYYERIKS